MPFAAGLRESLQFRDTLAASELRRGESLETVLARHLTTVERMFDGNILTSILLLSSDGTRLSHGAAPNLPQSYREAIDGSVIGPKAGSCGTAAFLNRPVYVSDIAADPLWAEYRHLALPHGLRSCWSTPIRNDQGSVTGSFAIYHRAIGAPTTDEIDAINMIATHVARAIIQARDSQASAPKSAWPRLALVPRNKEGGEESVHLSHVLLGKLEKLLEMAVELERCADASTPDESSAVLRSAAADLRKLADVIRRA